MLGVPLSVEQVSEKSAKNGTCKSKVAYKFSKKCLFLAPRRVLRPENARARRELPESVFKSQKGSFFDIVMTVRLEEENFGPAV